MTAIELMEKLLKEAEDAGIIEGYSRCPGGPWFDIEMTDGWLNISTLGVKVNE